MSTGIRGLMRGMANLLQGNQELLVARDKVERPPGELGVSALAVFSRNALYKSTLKYIYTAV